MLETAIVLGRCLQAPHVTSHICGEAVLWKVCKPDRRCLL